MLAFRSKRAGHDSNASGMNRSDRRWLFDMYFSVLVLAAVLPSIQHRSYHDRESDDHFI